MNDDELRDRIARLDPAGEAATEPITSPTARALLEEIMNTPLTDTEPRATGDAGATQAQPLAGTGAGRGGGNRRRARRGDRGRQRRRRADRRRSCHARQPGKLKVLELSTGAEDLLASCIVVTAESIAQAPVAFKGTVDTSEGGIVTLTIDQAYAGTDAQVATLVAPEGLEALIGGVEFVPGQQYLITAYDGVVNYCGHSGPATPELQALFDQAFPA